MNEVLRLFKELIKYEQKLSNEQFLGKAKPTVIELERKKHTDAFIKIKQLTGWNDDNLEWNVQYYRERKTNLEPYEDEWFGYVYNQSISASEYMEAYIDMFMK